MKAIFRAGIGRQPLFFYFTFFSSALHFCFRARADVFTSAKPFVFGGRFCACFFDQFIRQLQGFAIASPAMRADPDRRATETLLHKTKIPFVSRESVQACSPRRKLQRNSCRRSRSRIHRTGQLLRIENRWLASELGTHHGKRPSPMQRRKVRNRLRQ